MRQLFFVIQCVDKCTVRYYAEPLHICTSFPVEHYRRDVIGHLTISLKAALLQPADKISDTAPCSCCNSPFLPHRGQHCSQSMYNAIVSISMIARSSLCTTKEFAKHKRGRRGVVAASIAFCTWASWWFEFFNISPDRTEAYV